MSNLKPCPFCGSENLQVNYGFCDGVTFDNFYVSCVDCHKRQSSKTKEEALKLWNTRAKVKADD